jgi:hypothetical protein
VIAETVLKPALVAAGWQGRAAGWFTKEMTQEVTAVIAVSAASQHHDAGHASVTIHVGLRDDATERIVELVSGIRRPAYQGRTWVTPLGYLLPDSGYREGERAFDERNAATQADELTRLVVDHAEPRLRDIAGDPAELARLAEDSVSGVGPSGLCRVATLLCRAQDLERASGYVARRLTSLGDRTDPAAELERDVAPRLLAILGSN